MRLFCSICKEIFIPYSAVKVTNCGHLYHGSCISRWLKQNKTCPQCRCNITSQPFRIYFDVEKDNEADPSTLEHQIEVLSDKLRESEQAYKALNELKETCELHIQETKTVAENLQSENHLLKVSQKQLRKQIRQLTEQTTEIAQLKHEIGIWKEKNNTLEKVQRLINGTVEDVNKMLQSVTVSDISVKHLCMYVSVLKDQVCKCEAKNKKLAKENKELFKSLEEEKEKSSNEKDDVINNLKAAYKTMENEMHQMRQLLSKCAKKHSNNDEKSELSTHKVDKRPLFNMNIDVIDEIDEIEIEGNKKVMEMCDLSKTVTHWEDIICAGPSKNIGMSHNKTFTKGFFHNSTYEVQSRATANYAFDGMGGHKKIKIGGPTPRDEFLQVNKFGKKTRPSFNPKKTI